MSVATSPTETELGPGRSRTAIAWHRPDGRRLLQLGLATVWLDRLDRASPRQ